MSIQVKILSGIILMALLSLAAGGVGLWQVKRIEVQINEISDIVTPTIETADDLVYFATDMQKLIIEILADEELEDIKVLRDEFDKTVVNYEAALAELGDILIDPETENVILSLKDEQEAFFAAADSMYASHILELEYEISSEARQLEMDQLGDQLAEKLLMLSESNEAEMAAAEEQGDQLVASGQATAVNMNDILGDLFEREYPMVEAALKLASLINAIEASVGEVLAEEEPEDLGGRRQEFLLIAGEADQWLKVLQDFSETQADRDLASALTRDFADWVAMAEGENGVFDQHAIMLENELKADAFAEEVDRIGDDIVEQINIVIDAADVQSDSADERAAALVSSAAAILLGLSAITIALAVGLGLMVMRTVIAPLATVTDLMGSLTKGKLDVKIPFMERTDEIGRIANAVEVFRSSGVERSRLEQEAEQTNEEARLRQEQVDLLISRFREGMQSLLQMVLSDSNEMKSAATRLNQIAEATETTALEANNATEEASANVETVASATEEMTVSVQEINGQVSRGLNLVKSASTDAGSVNEKVKNLATAAQQIGEVIGMISDIAEQTNLLALNATIEAARAGEAGKGFAVVASEVKSLAEQTGKATEQISQQITTIQNSTEQAVVDIGGIASSVAEIDTFMASIASAIEEQSATTSEIARNVQEAATGNKRVSSGMNQVSSAVSDTKKSADSVLISSENLEKRSGEISREVENFLKEVEAA